LQPAQENAGWKPAPQDRNRSTYLATVPDPERKRGKMNATAGPPDRKEPLEREEYVEQAYFYRVLRERMQEGVSTQELLGTISRELLSTAKLPWRWTSWAANSA
jgi:hypothetical protein